MESEEKSNQAKQFNPPAEGYAGVYIYRGGGPGSALTKDIWIDGECIGQSAPNVFFYEEVTGGEEHDIATESEFSPNHMKLQAEAGRHYFVQQYIKMGVFVGGANLRLVDNSVGRNNVADLRMAKKAPCSK